MQVVSLMTGSPNFLQDFDTRSEIPKLGQKVCLRVYIA